MYEIDFLPVESANGPGSKSGDAIAIQFRRATTGEQMVVVIDGGFTDVGNTIADHIGRYYNTDYVDLAISTHPDADHINGLARLLERLRVGELLIHQPRLHSNDVRYFSNIEAVDNLIKVANSRGVKLSEPFTGLSRFEGQLIILSPTSDYYTALVAQHIAEERSGGRQAVAMAKGRILELARRLREKALSYFPIETLTDEGETGPRNNSSVVTLIRTDNQRFVFTGDAGIPALEAAADFYETTVGRFATFPLDFIQVPHHGSRRNVGPTILNRILGSPNYPHGSAVAFVSSAKADEKHPSPKVLNAFGRRGCSVLASEGQSIRHSHGAAPRQGWVTLEPLPPVTEDDDD